ncbi:hypothetical protein PPL19_15009 [Pseudomonas psychrotolerans L19]|nr:hypothetical protein PPL19_15009 [Pseudomonas psychrotolerans L19]
MLNRQLADEVSEKVDAQGIGSGSRAFNPFDGRTG